VASPLKRWLAETLAGATDGELSAAEILGADCSLAALGIGSLTLIRLVDAIEAELDIEVELDGQPWFLSDLDALERYVAGKRPSSATGSPDTSV
jgi:acyl carrier protein